MALTPGARLGPYEVTGQIGAGGMGEVYRATDNNLKRSVAIKVLPASVAGDADRLARFQREAEVLAALNHPNIGSIYGLEKTPDFTALIMELVEGDDLSQRIARGPIPLDEALPIAKQIADALEAAHEQGIVHRDLKPANIKVRADGTVKVLDFGLAKAMDSAGGTGGSATMSPTITTPAMTQAGMILGTAAYMSPEQAKGRAADRRSDAWAFGCVVYEMLSGRRAYEGDDVSDTLAAVLRGEPDWAALPPETPAAVTALLRHCLVKDRHQRVSGLAAAQFVFAQHAALISQANSVRMASGPARGRRWGLIATVAAALSITAVLAGTLGWRLKPSLPAPPVARFPLVLPASQLFGAFARHVVAVSPDGTLIVYVANSRLFLRSIGELDLHPLIGSESALTVSTPAFSPDSRSIAYHADGVIKRIAVSGGAAVSMCQTQGSLYVGEASNPNGMTWDDTGIVFARMNSGIFRCPPNGGAPERLAEIKDGELAQGPQLLPDGSTLIFAVAKAADGSNRWDRAQIVAQSLKTGQRKTLLTGGSDPRYLPTGHLLYAFGGTIFAVPFDPARTEVLGSPVPVVEGVRRALTGNPSGVAQFSVSRTGTLVYVPGPITVANESVMLGTADRSGVETRLPAQPGPYVHVRASPDGARLAVGSDDGKEAIVWIYDLAGTSAMRRLTIGGHNRFPIWSPDGQRVAFQSDREGDAAIFVQRADGTGPVQRLTKPASGETHIPESWSPDGKVLLFSAEKGLAYTLWRLSIGDKDSARFGRVESAEPTGATFSPDGRWVAYASSPAGGGVVTANRGVFVQPYPPTGDVFQAPLQRLDYHPMWGHNGTELLYIPTAASGQIAVVGVRATPTLSFGTVSSVPARVTGRQPSSTKRIHDILPDGRFVGVLSASGSDSSDRNQLRVVLNWTEELKARVPTR